MDLLLAGWLAMALMNFHGQHTNWHSASFMGEGRVHTSSIHECLHGGYQTVEAVDGSVFYTATQCVSYVAHGGSVRRLSSCAPAASTVGCFSISHATVFNADRTESVTLSGQGLFDSTCSGSCLYYYSQTLPYASGFGIYVHRDLSGHVLSSGTYVITGVLASTYVAGSSPVSCSVASSRASLLAATLTDGVTGQHSTVGLRVGTQTDFGARDAVVGFNGFGYAFGGTSGSIPTTGAAQFNC